MRAAKPAASSAAAAGDHGPSALRRRAGLWRTLTGSASTAVAAFALLAFGCALLAVAGPRASAELRTSAFRQLVARTPAAEKTIIGGSKEQSDGGTLDAELSGAVKRMHARALEPTKTSDGDGDKAMYER